jgi:hypothetical protein
VSSERDRSTILRGGHNLVGMIYVHRGREVEITGYDDLSGRFLARYMEREMEFVSVWPHELMTREEFDRRRVLTDAWSIELTEGGEPLE